MYLTSYLIYDVIVFFKTIWQNMTFMINFPLFFTILRSSKLSRKPIYKHENSGRFPCLYHILRISTAFSVKLIHLSANINNIPHLFTFSLYTITETPDFCLIVHFCLIVRFFPQSPHYQRHQETQK